MPLSSCESKRERERVREYEDSVGVSEHCQNCTTACRPEFSSYSLLLYSFFTNTTTKLLFPIHKMLKNKQRVFLNEIKQYCDDAKGTKELPWCIVYRTTLCCTTQHICKYFKIEF